MWAAAMRLAHSFYGRFADAGAAPTAGVSSAAHSTADEGSTLFAEEAHASTAAQTAAAAVGDTPVGLAGSPQPAKEKVKMHKSGIGSDMWQGGLMLPQHLSRLQMYHGLSADVLLSTRGHCLSNVVYYSVKWCCTHSANKAFCGQGNPACGSSDELSNCTWHTFLNCHSIAVLALERVSVQ